VIECRDTGLVCRHAAPHPLGAWYPSVVQVDRDTLLASVDVGQATESLDLRTCLTRSTDGGRSWTPPQPLFDDPVQPTSHSVRLGRVKDGTLVAMGTRRYHLHPEEGILNRANLGYTRMDVVQLSSTDKGRSWDGPRKVAAPLVGPAFETCHSVVELADGRWLYPTATWRGWDGQAPNGMKAVAFVSHDRGRTWREHLDVMDGSAEGIIYWEQSLVQLPDGRLMALCWAFHESSGTSLPNRFAISEDGQTFGPPRSAGMNGQTAKMLALGRNRVLCLYRRNDQPGLWAVLAEVESNGWNLLEQIPLWQGAASGMSGAGTSSDELAALQFGYPSMVRMSDQEVLALFWCCEDGLPHVRWLRLGVG
jgi:BNR repeat protein